VQSPGLAANTCWFPNLHRGWGGRKRHCSLKSFKRQQEGSAGATVDRVPLQEEVEKRTRGFSRANAWGREMLLTILLARQCGVDTIVPHHHFLIHLPRRGGHTKKALQQPLLTQNAGTTRTPSTHSDWC
jgi:hypothetical protein